MPGCDSSLLGLWYLNRCLQKLLAFFSPVVEVPSETCCHVYNQLPADSSLVFPILAFLSFLLFALQFSISVRGGFFQKLSEVFNGT